MESMQEPCKSHARACSPGLIAFILSVIGVVATGSPCCVSQIFSAVEIFFHCSPQVGPILHDDQVS